MVLVLLKYNILLLFLRKTTCLHNWNIKRLAHVRHTVHVCPTVDVQTRQRIKPERVNHYMIKYQSIKNLCWQDMVLKYSWPLDTGVRCEGNLVARWCTFPPIQRNPKDFWVRSYTEKRIMTCQKCPCSESAWGTLWAPSPESILISSAI